MQPPAWVKTIRFLRRFFCAVQAGKRELVAVAAVVERLVDAADGGGAGTGLPLHIAVDAPFGQHPRNGNALGQILQFLEGADILKLAIALLDGLKGLNRTEQLVRLRVLQLAHILPPMQ